MLPNAIVFEPKKSTFLNDYNRNFTGNTTVNDYGKSSIMNYFTERSNTEDKIGLHRIGVQQADLGFKTRLQDLPKITLKQTVDYSHFGNLQNKINTGNYLSNITDYTPKTTFKEMYVHKKYVPGSQKNYGLGYLIKNNVANTTLKELSTNKLRNVNDYRLSSSSRERNYSIPGKSNIRQQVKANTLLGELTNQRNSWENFEHGNWTNVIRSKENLGTVRDKNGDTSRIANTRIDQNIYTQLNDNPFVIRNP